MLTRPTIPGSRTKEGLYEWQRPSVKASAGRDGLARRPGQTLHNPPECSRFRTHKRECQFIELLITVINLAFELYVWVIIVSVVMSWLIAFNVVNQHSPAVRTVQRICWQLTEPLMRPVRRALPDLGGLDISPIVVLLGLQVVHIVIIRLLTGTLI